MGLPLHAQFCHNFACRGFSATTKNWARLRGQSARRRTISSLEKHAKSSRNLGSFAKNNRTLRGQELRQLELPEKLATARSCRLRLRFFRVGLEDRNHQLVEYVPCRNHNC